MKKALEGISTRINEAEEQISELEGRMVEITAMEQKNENKIRTVYLFIIYFFYLFYFLFVVNFVIHWNETAMGLHVFPIPIPPPTSLSTRSL